MSAPHGRGSGSACASICFSPSTSPIASPEVDGGHLRILPVAGPRSAIDLRMLGTVGARCAANRQIQKECPVPSTRILLSSWLIEVNAIARRSEALVAETMVVAAQHTEAVRRSRAFFAAAAAGTVLIESILAHRSDSSRLRAQRHYKCTLSGRRLTSCSRLDLLAASFGSAPIGRAT